MKFNGKIFALLTIFFCFCGAAQAQDSVFQTSLYSNYKYQLPGANQMARDGYTSGCRQRSSAGWRGAAQSYRGLARFHRQYANAFQDMANRTSNSRLRYSAGEEAQRQLRHARSAENNAKSMDRAAQSAARFGR